MEAAAKPPHFMNSLAGEFRRKTAHPASQHVNEKLALLAIRRDPAATRDKTIRIVRELDPREVEALGHSNQHLDEFETWDALMQIVEANYRSVATAFDQASRDAGQRALRGQLGTLINLTINRALINFTTGFKLYLDHTKTRLGKRFGDPSEALELYKKVTGEAFNRSFAYRFIGQLRDYTVHCGLPVSSATVTGRVTRDGGAEHTLRCAFDPLYLLRTGPSYWRGRVKADLEGASAPFAVDAILEEALVELKGINSKLTDFEKPLLHTSARIVLELVKGVFAADTIPAIGRIAPHPDGMDIELLDLPAQMMARLGYWKLEE